MWKTKNVFHISTPPATTADKYRKRRYTNIPLGTKDRSGQADYFQTSTYVHCSLPAIDNYFVEAATPFHVSVSTSVHETSQSTLFIVIIYLQITIGYALFGMNMDRPQKVDQLYLETLTTMKPIPRRYGRYKHSL